MPQIVEVFNISGTWTNPSPTLITTLDFVATIGSSGGTDSGGAGGGACNVALNVSVLSGDTNYAIQSNRSGYAPYFTTWDTDNSVVLAENGHEDGTGGLAANGVGDFGFNGGNQGTTGGGGAAGANANGSNGTTSTGGPGGSNGTYPASCHGGPGGNAGQNGVAPGGGPGALGAITANGRIVIAYTVALPAFTSSATVSTPENQQLDFELDATNIEGVDSLSIIGGADSTLFAIDGGGLLQFNSAPDFENPIDQNGDNVYEVIVQASNIAADTQQAISVTVTDVDDTPPTIVSGGGGDIASVNVVENTTAVMTVTATGPSPIDFTLSGDDQGSLFNIDSSTGVLTFLVPPDYENPGGDSGSNTYLVTVTATNGGGSDSQIIVVTVTNDPSDDGGGGGGDCLGSLNSDWPGLYS